MRIDKLKQDKNLPQSGAFAKVSLIIPFRNEEKNLKRCLDSIINQSYDSSLFEVILINDSSTDNSKEVIKHFIELPNFKLFDLLEDKENLSRKKQAIDFGIRHSTNEIIMTTDADCWHDKDWMKNIVSKFDERTGFVAGPIIYSKAESFFEKLQVLEFGSLVSVGAALIGNKLPLLANGATCAYRKSLFYEVGGFRDNLNLVSGDEEFLMQKIHFNTRLKIKFSFSNGGLTYTKPNRSLKEFFNQRKRWSSKILFYKNKAVLTLLVLIYAFYLFLFLLIAVGVTNSKLIEQFGMLFVGKLLMDFLFLYTSLKLLKLRKYLVYLPIAEVLHIPYILLTPLFGTFGKFNWKGRDIKN